jgi:hypothetical protein
MFRKSPWWNIKAFNQLYLTILDKPAEEIHQPSRSLLPGEIRGIPLVPHLLSPACKSFSATLLLGRHIPITNIMVVSLSCYGQSVFTQSPFDRLCKICSFHSSPLFFSLSRHTLKKRGEWKEGWFSSLCTLFSAFVKPMGSVLIMTNTDHYLRTWFPQMWKMGIDWALCSRMDPLLGSFPSSGVWKANLVKALFRAWCVFQNYRCQGYNNSSSQRDRALKKETDRQGPVLVTTCQKGGAPMSIVLFHIIPYFTPSHQYCIMMSFY